MTFSRTLALICATAFGIVSVAEANTTLRAATLKIGTVNWELSTIMENGIDRANGFEMMAMPMADNGATRVAFAGGEADMVVADWIWVAQQRAEGKDYVFIPYSTAVGSLLVKADSPVQSLADLQGAKIGIAGGPVDKSWLILRAFAKKEYGIDLKGTTEQVFGAPPLIMKAGLKGDTNATINFWHFLAKMKAAGMREVISTATAAKALGLDPNTPLLGYVLKESFIAENPGIAQALYQASRAAKERLANEESAWEAIRPIMNANNDAQFAALKADWIAGIPREGTPDTVEVAKMLELMADLGGQRLVGKATTLPDGLFVELE